MVIWDGMGDKIMCSSEYFQYLAFKNQNMTILIKHRGHDIFLLLISMSVTQYIFFSSKLILTNSESQVLKMWGLIGSDFCQKK